ncbi:MAG: hypothetical protein H6765_01715 [Candidatus Peribacteria bacterium]|nr:MAG: hypothetical protein H6765_01715 [Candidatus Peribacteria bacterium]
MTVGILKDGRLCVRVQEDICQELLKEPEITPMDLTGKILKEFILVEPERCRLDIQLQEFIALGVQHAMGKLGHL